MVQQRLSWCLRRGFIDLTNNHEGLDGFMPDTWLNVAAWGKVRKFRLIWESNPCRGLNSGVPSQLTMCRPLSGPASCALQPLQEQPALTSCT